MRIIHSFKHFAVLGFALLLLAPPTAAAAKYKVTQPPVSDGHVSDLKLSDNDYSIGLKEAKIVLVEYASLTCPHCAQFHTKVLPGLKKEFIDTGKVRYVYRDFPLDRLALGAAMVARCSGRETFFGFIETFYNAQSRWSRSPKPEIALAKLARLGGMSQNKFNQCLQNADIQGKILQQRMQASNDFDVRTTPTVFVNGNRYDGGISLDQFRALLNVIKVK